MPSIHIQTEIPGPRSREISAARQQHVAPGPFHTTPIVAAHAEGAVITDVDGNRFLDFASGIGVTNLGHRDPTVMQAIARQSEQFVHTSINVVAYEGYVRLAERLNALLPEIAPCKTFLANSGAEAVENAVKFARAATGRQAVIAFEHGYHGRTYMAMALTAKAHPYKSGFAPFPAEVYRAAYPDFYRWPGVAGDPGPCPGGGGAGCPPERCKLERCLCGEAFAAFAEMARAQIGEANVAAVIIEPVAGEGGFIPAPAPFLAMLRRWCDEHGVVLIFDEVQTGFGRTGSLLACQQLGVTPDLVVMAKGLANGLPLSAVTGRADVIDAVGVGGVGGTYCGNPLACAAALAVLDRFDDPAVLAHARHLGERLRERLESFAARFPRIGQTRGLGPMRAIELVSDRATKTPDKAAAQSVVRHAYEHGLILMACGTHGNVLRFLIPLTLTDDQLDEGLAVVEAGLTSLE
jgi:4-aminobutyrate aminotransferase/(S)-3-amino-2-methylpropionate transaminase